MPRKRRVSVMWEFAVMLGKGVGWLRVAVWQMYRLCSVKETSWYFEILPYPQGLVCRTSLETHPEGLNQRAASLLGEYLLSFLVPWKCTVETADVN